LTSPSEGPADALEQRYERLRAWLVEYKATTSFTWAKIGREVGYAESSLSLFAGGKYPLANSAHLLDTLDDFARLADARRSALARPAFVMTSIAKAINRLVWETQLLRRIGIISGEVGIGKSEAVRNHAAGAPSAAYIVLNPHVKTSHALLPKMLAAIGRSERRSLPPHVLYDRLVEYTRDSSWYFLIDEANFLRSEALNTLRCYQEEAGGIPIVLTGNAELYQNAQWTGGGRARESSAAFTQFESRCAVRAHLTAADVKPSDVMAIAEQIVGVEVTRGCADLLLRQAQNASGGSMRNLIIILQKARNERQDPSAPVTKVDIALAIDRHTRGVRAA
jgi:DNA transposition AAA+ family ATPase